MVGTLTIHPYLPYTAHGNERTEVYYTYRASTKANKSSTDNSTTKEHIRYPSISYICISDPGTTDTISNGSIWGYIGNYTRK